jgi:hypothetical protein
MQGSTEETTGGVYENTFRIGDGDYEADDALSGAALLLRHEIS